MRASSATASLGSVCWYRSSNRAWVSSLAGSNFCGTQDITCALPRTTSGVTAPTPSTRLSRRLTRPSDAISSRARFSHPVCAGPRPREPALQNVLAIEMRALAIGRRRGVHDRCLLRLVEPVQIGHRRIEREEAVERQRRRLAVEDQGAIAAQADPVGIADRRHCAQAIKCAAEHDHEQAGIAAFGPRQSRHLAPGKQGAGAEQRFAAARQVMQVMVKVMVTSAGIRPT